jgi:hypothetical protein
MRLQNVTLALIVAGRIVRLLENPEVPSKDGKPVLGKNLRRVHPVRVVAKMHGISINEAQKLRRDLSPAILAGG